RLSAVALAKARNPAPRIPSADTRFITIKPMHTNPSDAELKELMSKASTIAVVGASSNPERPSNGIMRKLLSVGYHVIPVNPHETEVLGERAYPSLSDVSVPVDIVDVFRRSEYTPSIADEA